MSLRPIPLAAACAAFLAACGQEEPGLNNQQFAEAIENVAEARPEPDPKPEAPGPSLVAIASEDIAGALAPGAGCDFSSSGGLLFASIGTDALARVNGIATRLRASAPIGPSGGFFEGERFAISIGRLDDLADNRLTPGAATSWPARLVLSDRRRDTSDELRLEGTWRCGVSR